MAEARQRTLVIQPLPGIGDMVWHLPHLHAIAATTPHGQVSVLTKPRSLADRLLMADASVEEVLWLKRNPGEHDGVAGLLRLAAELRRRRFASVWILHASARYAMACWLAGIPHRIGYGVGAQRLFLDRRVRLPEECRREHPIDQATRLLRLCGLDDIEDEPRLPVSAQADAEVRARHADAAPPWLALGLGSSEPFKQWGADNFAALAHRLTMASSATLFLVGGPGERAIAEHCLARLDARWHGRIRLAVGLPLEQTVALLARCRLYVGNDTGVLNIAAATGVDALGLFGSSPPLRHSRHIHAIYPDDGRVPSIDSRNMAGISVERVAREVLRHLATHPPQRAMPAVQRH